MNKYQEALNRIKEMLVIFGRPTCSDLTDVIQELVDKETPMKVNREEYYLYGDEKLAFDGYNCPTCNNELQSEIEIESLILRCYICGQKLDWSE